MSAKREGINREKVNNSKRRVFVPEKMLNWVDQLDIEFESEDDTPCYDEYFPVAIEYSQQK